MASRWVVGACARFLCLLTVIAIALAGAARAESKAGGAKGGPSKGGASCQHDGDDGEDDDDDEGVRFAVAAGCAKVTGGVSYTYQGTKQIAGVPRIVNRNGTVTQNTMSQSVTASGGLEYTRQTSLGEFKSTIGGEWSKSTDDGTTNGSAYFTGWSVGLGGLTVGYTGSLMSFWEGNFLTSASSPARSATTIVYEQALDAANKVAVGVESSLPTSPNADTNYLGVRLLQPDLLTSLAPRNRGVDDAPLRHRPPRRFLQLADPAAVAQYGRRAHRLGGVIRPQGADQVHRRRR